MNNTNEREPFTVSERLKIKKRIRYENESQMIKSYKNVINIEIIGIFILFLNLYSFEIFLVTILD